MKQQSEIAVETNLQVMSEPQPGLVMKKQDQVAAKENRTVIQKQFRLATRLVT